MEVIKIRKVINVFRNKVLDLGYTEFRDDYWSALFCKILDNGLFLTLGFQMSSLYFNTWTANLYLGTTTRIGAVFGDIPFSCDQRVPNLLDSNEKEKVGIPCVQDYWWTSIDESAISSFCKALEIAESKLTSDVGLVQDILKSKESFLLKKEHEMVINTFLSDSIHGTYEFCPEHDYRDISVRWFQAAEDVLKEKELVKSGKYKLSKTWVWRTALRVFREYSLINAGFRTDTQIITK